MQALVGLAEAVVPSCTSHAPDDRTSDAVAARQPTLCGHESLVDAPLETSRLPGCCPPATVRL
jgi:hypothetical protein